MLRSSAALIVSLNTVYGQLTCPFEKVPTAAAFDSANAPSLSAVTSAGVHLWALAYEDKIVGSPSAGSVPAGKKGGQIFALAKDNINYVAPDNNVAKFTDDKTLGEFKVVPESFALRDMVLCDSKTVVVGEGITSNHASVYVLDANAYKPVYYTDGYKFKAATVRGKIIYALVREKSLITINDVATKAKVKVEAVAYNLKRDTKLVNVDAIDALATVGDIVMFSYKSEGKFGIAESANGMDFVTKLVDYSADIPKIVVAGTSAYAMSANGEVLVRDSSSSVWTKAAVKGIDAGQTVQKIAVNEEKLYAVAGANNKYSLYAVAKCTGTTTTTTTTTPQGGVTTTQGGVTTTQGGVTTTQGGVTTKTTTSSATAATLSLLVLALSFVGVF